jgi:MIP family channel proteins
MLKHARKYVAEFLGTFALVFVGAGAVIVDGHTGTSHRLADAGKLGIVGIALAHGLTLTAMLYGLGSISGGHFNPAISLAAWVRKRVSGEMALGYVGAQLVGGLLAAVLLATIFPDEVTLAQLGTPGLGPRISGLQGFAIEAAITFLLAVVVLTSTRADNTSAHPFAGMAIGGTLVGIILFAGPLTGASANPARYLGPAIVSRSFDQIWLYILAPLYGGALAAFLLGLGVEVREPAGKKPQIRNGKSTSRLGRGRRRDDSEEEIADEEEAEELPVRNEMLTDRAQRAFKKAQDLYWGGDGERAAATLVPLLARASREGKSISEQVRSLLVVIEDTHGPLPILEGYRQLLQRPQT